MFGSFVVSQRDLSMPFLNKEKNWGFLSSWFVFSSYGSAQFEYEP